MSAGGGSVTSLLTYAGGERRVGHEARLTAAPVAAHRVQTLAVRTHPLQLALVHICPPPQHQDAGVYYLSSLLALQGANPPNPP